MFSADVLARFWAKVDKSGECWVWVGYHNAKGYGKITINGKMEMAHRVAWEIEHGPIPSGQKVLHACDNPPCVRHLFLGTPADNSADMVAKGRVKRGPQLPQTKLTEAQVRAIRARYEPGRRGSVVQLAREFGVHHATISGILHNEFWRHAEVQP